MSSAPQVMHECDLDVRQDPSMHGQQDHPEDSVAGSSHGPAELSRPPSEPHRALQTEDILHEIFDHLAIAEDKRTLTKLILVSRFFCEPALDALWRKLYDIMPLLKVLASSFVLRIFEDGAHRSVGWILKCSPLEEEWQRFVAYARRIRYLSVPTNSDIHRTVFVDLIMHAGGKPIFTSLVSLKLPHIRHSSAMMLLFSSPMLRCLKIYSHYSLTEDALLRPLSFFDRHGDALALKAPFLREIHIMALSLKVPQSLALFTRLQTVCFTGDMASVLSLRELANLPELQSLRVVIGHRILGAIHGEDTDIPVSTSVPGFLALRSLEVMGHPSEIVQILGLISSPHLSSFRCFFRPLLRSDGWVNNRQCFAILGSRFAASLCTISITTSMSDGAPHGFMDVLRPLLKAQHLEEVSISTESILNVTNDDVHDMASSWPRLQVFSLIHLPAPQEPCVYSLRHFARHCPQLFNLRLRCTVSTTDAPPPDPAASNPAVYVLTLGYAIAGRPAVEIVEPIADPVTVARFIVATFPNATVFGTSASDFDRSRGWGRVAQVVSDLHKENWKHIESGPAGTMHCSPVLLDRPVTASSLEYFMPVMMVLILITYFAIGTFYLSICAIYLNVMIAGMTQCEIDVMLELNRCQPCSGIFFM